MRRDCCWFGMGLLTLALAVPGRAEEVQAKPGPEQVEFFESKVRPVLAAHCLGCHGPEKQKGNLRLDSSDAMRTGGDGGPAVAPGDPEQSPLIEAIRYDGPTQMPPKGKLDDAEIAALTEWVKRGRTGPRRAPRSGRPRRPEAWTITDEDRAFWAFRPVQDPPAPAVKDAAWPRSPIDRFVLARLEEKGLRPSPPADKVTLIRRATFDLIGLPPTPEEVEAFVADTSPEAFARVVDRLLASPHYGERWGRHWLDVARYGEDQAHSFKPRLYPNGFQYRDWVAAALNADMPYDQFVLEQIAGDLLPDEPGRRLRRLPALGYFALRAGLLRRQEAVRPDRRPHRHAHPRLPRPDGRLRPLPRPQVRPDPDGRLLRPGGRLRRHRVRGGPLRAPGAGRGLQEGAGGHRVQGARDRRVAEGRVGPARRVPRAGGRPLPGRRLEDEGDAAGLRPRRIARRGRRAGGARSRLAQAMGRLPRRVAGEGRDEPPLAPWSGWIARLKQVPEGGADEASLPRSSRPPGRSRSTCSPCWPAARGCRRGPKAGGGGAEGRSDKSGLDGESKALLDKLFGAKGVMGVPKERVEKLLPDESRARLSAMRSEMERMKKTAPPSYPVVHTLKDGQSPKAMTVLIRGNPETPGPEAPRRFLSILGGTPLATGSGRLELARAIATPDNPLTARVMVNRLWQLHFGRGLVGTPSNFGKLGERPTHPELLDHLAHRFVAEGLVAQGHAPGDHALGHLSGRAAGSTSMPSRSIPRTPCSGG